MVINFWCAVWQTIQWIGALLDWLCFSGRVTDCGTYRSVINSAEKVYVYMLDRLMSWYKPYREQTGAQPKRSCIEHDVALRLIIGYCVRKKLQLYVAFIDFSKAYDKVPRGKLFKVLKSLGCGGAMILARMSMLCDILGYLGLHHINSIHRWQGTPTSCFLFVMFVDMLIRKSRQQCGDNGFQKWLHVLMLMDDTIIMATSRERLTEKLKYLEEYCDEFGLLINESKTKFMAILGSEEGRQPIQLASSTVRHSNSSIYLEPSSLLMEMQEIHLPCMQRTNFSSSCASSMMLLCVQNASIWGCFLISLLVCMWGLLVYWDSLHDWSEIPTWGEGYYT